MAAWLYPSESKNALAFTQMSRIPQQPSPSLPQRYFGVLAHLRRPVGASLDHKLTLAPNSSTALAWTRVQRLAKFFTLTNCSNHVSFRHFVLVYFLECRLFLCCFTNKCCDGSSPSRQQAWPSFSGAPSKMMNSISLAFSSFHIYELRLSVWRRKGRIENASVLFFKFALGSDRAGRSTWSNTQRRGRH
jgi:hypothetical protein